MPLFSFSDNKVIRSMLTKLPGEILVVPLTTAPDQPNCCITFSVRTGSTGISVGEHGVLTWDATANNDTRISLGATNGCAWGGIFGVSLRIHNCQCKNNGTCQNKPGTPLGSAEYSCKCPVNFSGALCENLILVEESIWSAWSKCDAECGGGKTVRTKSCPEGSECSESEMTEERACNTDPCAVWTHWSSWSECDHECERNRTRHCPGEKCETRQETELEVCNTRRCPGK